MRHSTAIVAMIASLVAACSANSERALEAEGVMVPVLVADCYSHDEGLSVSVNGKPISLVAPPFRNDSTAVCADTEVPGAQEMLVELIGQNAGILAVPFEPDKVLVISATDIKRLRFLRRDQLAFD